MSPATTDSAVIHDNQGVDSDWKSVPSSGASDTDGSESDEDRSIAAPPLLPIAHSIASPTDSLCDVCKDLNLSPNRFVVLPSDNETQNKPHDPNINMGTVKAIRSRSHCPFCRLVLVALGGKEVPDEEDGKDVSAVMSWSTDGIRPDVNQPWNHIPQIRTLSPSAQKGKGEYVGSMRLNLFPEITLLANDSPTDLKAFFVRPIHDDRIDFSVVRNWLSLCKRYHGDSCNKSKLLNHKITNPPSEIPSFRLIDVNSNCLVLGPPHCQYAALSYVWGKRADFLRTLSDTVNELEKPGALLRPEFYDRVPPTIRDAMQVVREIGLQYLWVDCLCIVQDDETGSKADAIAKMDLVYGGAFVTIMAASAMNANTGLPGVRPGTRGERQPIEEIMPGFRLAFKPKYEDYIKDAVYYTRAWTFQEQQFTSRSLLFIGGQVVFNCRQADQWREDVVCEDKRIVSKQLKAPETNDIGNFEGLLQTYSEMSLTYESDIYNAFAGLSRYFQSELKTDLCHGIPNIYFDWFLLWYPLREQHRRKLAPSWSWSGWIGASYPRMWDWYTRRIDKIHGAQRTRTWIIWYHRLAHNSTKCVPILPPKKNKNDKQSTTRSQARNFYGGRVRDRFPFDCSKTLPSDRTLNGAPEYYKDTLNRMPGSGFLQFWTVSVMLSIKPATSAAKLGPDNKCLRLGIFGRDSERELGTLYLTLEWCAIDGNVGGTHEFILLCEGREDRAENQRYDEEPGWKYMIMLIEWHGDWAERISIGCIDRHDLNEALSDGPAWKEIILG
ncbi:heterokaryon incompatibility protein-domain-containing protein [Crucibulum laeve]|uniref:Heterokaryon incompatibility protein-domain-containing protein n=1 Tax=Crucibulum laeve TaxID=68775 RepID=A0A5C3LHW0_9AGAR|nr:heterokaryon incompatibility protein-domain-containing protein [Crucibulum laeve]